MGIIIAFVILDVYKRQVCDQSKALGTVDGNVLLINIHIAAGDTERPVFFPEAHEARYTNRYASLLYDCSSEMPAVFNEAIREAKGPGAIQMCIRDSPDTMCGVRSRKTLPQRPCGGHP